MTIATKSLGICPSDIVVRTAVVWGIQELRAKPWLLDYVFAGIPADELTAPVYGKKEVDAAKRWFLRTPVHVVLAKSLRGAKFPCVAILLASSREVKSELGDVNYEVDEPKPWSVAYQPPLTDPFTPLSYDRTTGRIVLPTSVAGDDTKDPPVPAQAVFAAGQIVQTRAGKLIPIVAAEGAVLYVAPNQVVELAGAVVRGQDPPVTVQLKSSMFAESYALGVFTVDEAQQQCLWLHAILQFVLLRGRQHLLEARGLQNTAIESSDMKPGTLFPGMAEALHARYVTLSGEVLQWWPQDEDQRSVLDYALVGERASTADDAAPLTSPDGSPVILLGQ